MLSFGNLTRLLSTRLLTPPDREPGLIVSVSPEPTWHGVQPTVGISRYWSQPATRLNLLRAWRHCTHAGHMGL